MKKVLIKFLILSLIVGCGVKSKPKAPPKSPPIGTGYYKKVVPENAKNIKKADEPEKDWESEDDFK